MNVLYEGEISFWAKASSESNGDDLVVHLGPAISESSFVVGPDVKDQYLSKNIEFNKSFSFSLKNIQKYKFIQFQVRKIKKKYKIIE